MPPGLALADGPAVTIVAVGRRSRRGGNRLRPQQYPVRGPTYQRRRCFGADPERRDRNQRSRTRRAVAVALTRGELPDRLAAVLYQLLDRCTDTLLCPAPDGGPACSGWWSERYIHGLIFPDGDDRTDEEANEWGGGDTKRRGARTAGRWMAELAQLGWVESIHRHRLVNGEISGTSNLWRLRIPDHLRGELHADEDTRRAQVRRPGSAGRATPKGPRSQDHTDRQAAAAARSYDDHDERRTNPCPQCNGVRRVEQADGRWDNCPICRGSGTARGGP